MKAAMPQLLSPESPLVPNAQGRRMTRSGIEHRLRVTVQRASPPDPSLRHVRISPHTMRRTTTMHLLESGNDLSVIPMWLGHESIQTTHQYHNADLETKKRTLAHLKAPKVPHVRNPATRPLIQILDSL